MGLFRKRNIIRFRDRVYGDQYAIEFCRDERSGRYAMYCHKHPRCVRPLGPAAHLLEGNLICVASGREPHTLEQAKAVAVAWMYGFSEYLRTGDFPNGKFRADIGEIGHGS